MYTVYRVTPDMWEWPWVCQLLGSVPISHSHGLDLRTLPAAHPRLRHLARTAQSPLPAGVRPTRRLWRRATDFHDFSIYVYNTWALDPDMISELSSLLSTFDHVGLVSIDESCQDSPDVYERVSIALRIGFGAPQYKGVEGLLVAPLGVPKHFVRPGDTIDITKRQFSWSFLGELKNPSRRNMIAQLDQVKGERFLHAISTWDAEDSLRGMAYSNILANSVFVPSPSANVHSECYRTYEALECGAIPVVDTEYYRDEFGAPFPVAQPTWEDAPDMLNAWLADPDCLEELDRECQGWWRGIKTGLPARLRLLTQAGL